MAISSHAPSTFDVMALHDRNFFLTSVHKSRVELFATKYQELYNHVSYSDTEMAALKERLDDRISNSCTCSFCTQNAVVSPTDIALAATRLNPNKKDGGGLFATDHVIHGGRILHEALSTLFTAMMCTGIAPTLMLDSVVVPIPKNTRKSLNESSNYRGIALNSPLSKLFEITLLMSQTAWLSTSDLQFGFKRRCSTTQCTFVLLETINYYLERDTSVYCMLLDASQAFDNVQYITLFTALIERGMCPFACRVLLNMHTGQAVCIRWGQTTSSSFSVRNGVKQSGILSPVLFTI
jgi:hypothetical protein